MKKAMKKSGVDRPTPGADLADEKPLKRQLEMEKSQDALPEPAVGLSASTQAIGAIRAVLGPEEFWRPDRLKEFPSEEVDLLILESSGGFRSSVESLMALRSKPAWERIMAGFEIYRAAMRTVNGSPADQEPDWHGFAFAARLPLEILRGNGLFHGDLTPSGEPSWLPEGLHVPGNLNLRRAPLVRLPAGLKVGRNLIISDCNQLAELPSDLEVGGSIIADHCRLLSQLPKGLRIPGSLDLSDTPVVQISGLRVGGDLLARHCSRLEIIGGDLGVRRSVYAQGSSNLKAIQGPTEIGGSLWLDEKSVGIPVSSQAIIHGRVFHNS